MKNSAQFFLRAAVANFLRTTCSSSHNTSNSRKPHKQHDAVVSFVTLATGCIDTFVPSSRPTATTRITQNNIVRFVACGRDEGRMPLSCLCS
mmetsp:Transcript_31513/g.52589  ORF Transcript_31513/g.52589 Transcript_31513/m.52589 type:complete len:92 (-) Transcript_31513:26-301(-)